MKYIILSFFTFIYLFNSFACSGVSYDTYQERLENLQENGASSQNYFFTISVDNFKILKSEETPIFAFKGSSDSIFYLRFISISLKNNRGILRIRKNSTLTGGLFSVVNLLSKLNMNNSISKFVNGEIIFNFFLGGVNSENNNRTSNSGVLLNFPDKEFFTLTKSDSYLFTIEPEDKNAEIFLTLGWQEVKS